MILDHDTNGYDLFKRAAALIHPSEVLIDVGSGIRPQKLIPCKRHLCLEPHSEYIIHLREAGYEVVEGEAPEALDAIEGDTIAALDVIEHMEKEKGLAFKHACERRAQAVIFTPLGFMPQPEDGPVDAWGFHGQEYQRHRSGWLPEEFPGWRCVVQEHFHSRNGGSYGAFFAVWTRP